MRTFVTSDTHFNHRGILAHCPRPWDSMEAMNEGLIAAWNATVKPKDEVWVLGDWGFDTKDGLPLPEVFARLNGVKHLVIGNHDEDRNTVALALPWASQSHLHTLRRDGRRAVLCHYPMETWKNAQRGYLMLHGHSHGSLKRVIPHRFDVGVDALGTSYGYGPIPFTEICRLADQQAFKAQDHHGD